MKEIFIIMCFRHIEADHTETWAVSAHPTEESARKELKALESSDSKYPGDSYQLASCPFKE